MDEPASFGAWLKQRRQALLLTRAELAQRIGCAVVTLRKIESDERRPSKQIAQRLAELLEVAPDERPLFVRIARAEAGLDRLPAVRPQALSTPTRAVSAAPHAALPGGTVTFLFTDIAGSTQLWEQYPNAMRTTLARHDAILGQAIQAHSGHVFKTVGDAVYAVFARAADALAAALTAQYALRSESWGATGPLGVRMALHTGAAEPHDGDYHGLPLSRAARLLAASHGGQVVLSLATEELVREELSPEITLRDLGTHRLKDLTLPERIFQLVAPGLPADFPPLNSLDARRANLPAQPTLLIGREAEVAGVSALLCREDVRLLTLTGPGGIGKTRLGVQAAAEVLDNFADGVAFVNLAPISDPALVASTIAQALGVKETGGRPLLDSLKDYLGAKQILLLLDNFEQVLDAAPLIAELLTAALRLKVLVTSRAVLHLRGEKEFPVPPLALPDLKRGTPVAALSQYAAVQLFIARALDARPDFEVTNDTAPAVAEICYRLDGLPLAIELAAARIKLFTPEALLARLDRRLPVLIGGARDLPARQQTLRATIDWSYALLTADEQALFRRLGVFVGGCTLEAAEAVCGELKMKYEKLKKDDDSDAFTIFNSQVSISEGLAALIDKSLLRQQEGAGGEPRYLMLETIREHALEQLEAGREIERQRQAHANYYLELAETAGPELRGRRQKVWLERLEPELDNLRAALTWSLAGGEAEVGVRIAGALEVFWGWRAYLVEGRRWLEDTLAQTTMLKGTGRAKALAVAGFLASIQGDLVAARAHCEESLTISIACGDQRGRARALLYLAWTLLGEGDIAAAHAHHEEALALCRSIGDRWGTAGILADMAFAATGRGNHAQATCLAEEALALFQDVGDQRETAFTLYVLGTAVYNQGDYARATSLLEESLSVSREIGDVVWGIYFLLGLGDVALCQGDYTRSAARYQEALAICHDLGDKNGRAAVLHNLGRVLHAQGNIVQARTLLAESAAWFQDRGSPDPATILHLAAVIHAQGNIAYAATLLHEALALQQQQANKQPIAESLELAAELAVDQGQAARAARLLGAAAALRESFGAPLPPGLRAGCDRAMKAAQARLGDAAFAAAWAAGQALTLEQAIAMALDEND